MVVRRASRKQRLRSAMSEFNDKLEDLEVAATVTLGKRDFKLLTEDNPDLLVTGAENDSAEYVAGFRYGIRIDRDT